jgi:hypothetical protein
MHSELATNRYPEFSGQELHVVALVHSKHGRLQLKQVPSLTNIPDGQSCKQLPLYCTPTRHSKQVDVLLQVRHSGKHASHIYFESVLDVDGFVILKEPSGHTDRH